MIKRCKTCGEYDCHCTWVLADNGTPEQPKTVVNAAGGTQAAIPYTFTASFPHGGLLEVAKVIHKGLRRYQADNWRLIPQNDHIDHALTHVFLFLLGDRSEPHLGHAATRILFALETSNEPGK